MASASPTSALGSEGRFAPIVAIFGANVTQLTGTAIIEAQHGMGFALLSGPVVPLKGG